MEKRENLIELLLRPDEEISLYLENVSIKEFKKDVLQVLLKEGIEIEVDTVYKIIKSTVD